MPPITVDPASIPPPAHTLRAWELMQRIPAVSGALRPPGELADTNYFTAMEVFQRFDVNKDGCLDQREFQKLMVNLCPGRNDWNEIAKYFKDEVDRDGTGLVNFPRFLQWVFCGNQSVSRNVLDMTNPSSPNSGAEEWERGSAASSATASGGSLVIKFTFEPGFRLQMGGIMRMLQPLDGQIDVRTATNKTARGCKKVEVLLGKGIKLWDWETMVTHHEYPFRSMESTNEWVADLVKKHIPLLLLTARLQ